jgi:ribosomal protein S18 acetylase RimI-like enzyme
MSFAIRPYHPSDLYSLYRICLQTGESGQDASALYADPELLGHMFAAPYGIFEPETCFILTHDHVPCGYILAAPDTPAFWQRCEDAWFPVLRKRYPMPDAADQSRDAWVIRMLHADHSQSTERMARAAAYPAHLHIDLLPFAQGQGWGRTMVATLLEKLASLGVPGVHLGVGAKNRGGIAFYQKTGFTLLEEHESYHVYGIETLKR